MIADLKRSHILMKKLNASDEMQSYLHLIRTIKSLERMIVMTLVQTINSFIYFYEHNTSCSGFEDTYENYVERMKALCTNEDEKKLVSWVISQCEI